MKVIKGKIKWYECGASQFSGDQNYFLAVAVEMDDAQKNLAGEDTEYYKAILKDKQSHSCLKEARLRGITSDGNKIFPSTDQTFEFHSSAKPVVSGKSVTEYKYNPVAFWRFI